MKTLTKDFALNRPGTVKMIPEEPDDLWVVYNLIANGDVVTANMTHKVDKESAKNPTSCIKLTLPVKVTCLDFDKDSSTLPVRGRRIEDKKYVAAGDFHNLTSKRTKSLRALQEDLECCGSIIRNLQESPGADLAMVLIQESQGELYLVGNGLTRSALQSKLPQPERTPCFSKTFNAFVKHADFSSIKSVMIASARSAKDKFRRFLLSEAERLKMRTIENKKLRIVVAGCKGNLKEVLNNEGVMNIIKDSMAGLEIRAIRELRHGGPRFGSGML